MNNRSSIPHGDLGLVITWWWNVSTTKRNTSIKPAYLFWRSKILVDLRRERGGESKKDKKKKRKEKERGLAGVPLRQARAWLQWLCCPCMLLVSSLLLFIEDRACLRQHSINLHLLFYNLFIHCNLTKQIIFLLLIIINCVYFV
jgi:hypothetical protein